MLRRHIKQYMPKEKLYMLMNIGPRSDGSIHPDTEKGIIELGRIIDERGWPKVVHEIPARLE